MSFEVSQSSLQPLLYDIEAGMPFLFIDARRAGAACRGQWRPHAGTHGCLGAVLARGVSNPMHKCVELMAMQATAQDSNSRRHRKSKRPILRSAHHAKGKLAAILVAFTQTAFSGHLSRGLPLLPATLHHHGTDRARCRQDVPVARSGFSLTLCQFLGFRQTAHRRAPASSASKTPGKRIELSTVDARVFAADAVNAKPDPQRK